MKIGLLGKDNTIKFAADELKKYLKMMSASSEIEIIENEEMTDKDCIIVGISPKFSDLLEKVEDNYLDDAIYINIKNGAGIITGTNPRSVLIGVYRFLREAGCAFIRPGTDNEVIPSKDITGLCVFVSEKASYRHREVCIEGAVSFEHVYDMLDWIPKIAMNGYYMQFLKPYGFFRKWYEHKDNPYIEAENKTDEELDEMLLKLDDEIAKRGLLYFSVGHGWNSDPLGVKASYWDVEPEPPEHIRKYLAELKGKRDWFEGVPLDTNLCYSNPEVQELMTDYAVKYCIEHPNVDYIVFWLADRVGNTCECSECKKGTFTDFYVQILNLLDKKLTEKNIKTRVVFSSKFNMPVKEKFNKTDRILKMSCPIFRNQAVTYPDKVVEEELPVLPVFDENETQYNRIFNSIPHNIAKFKRWNDFYKGDTVIYDYQLIWYIHETPGYMFSSKTIAKDIRNLKVLGLNGMNSCQVQRLFFPTSLPMISLSETLWNRDADFDEFTNRYFENAFGKDGDKLKNLLLRIDQPEINVRMETWGAALAWEETKGQETISKLEDGYKAAEEIKVLVEENLKNTNHPEAVKKSWEYLKLYPEFAKLYIDMWVASYGENDIKKCIKAYEALCDFVNKNEQTLNRVLDGFMFKSRLYHFFKKKGETTVHE